MPIGLLEKIWDQRPKNARLLGLDLGDRTIGLSVSDAGQSIATPLKTIRRTKFSKDFMEMETVIYDYEIKGYVLGWPLNMDGSIGQRCDIVRSFADEMTKNELIVGHDPWIALWDERLSTAAVEDFLIESVNMSRARRKQVVDKLAAQYILQGALDYIQSRRKS
ncbi:MAG: Holliday junction resolvase RuvX [Alphaproteobacteria bacterium CG_4_9_14_3_um_filter_47_13]|nr:MAG: Holliday junction resolvase RuvX [Alphaproteobacteria bacterium CG_4_9_14_3_um_filter_47_13]